MRVRLKLNVEYIIFPALSNFYELCTKKMNFVLLWYYEFKFNLINSHGIRNKKLKNKNKNIKRMHFKFKSYLYNIIIYMTSLAT